jgi:TetR/AcrR family transcriptional regulator, regulator of cefoperazone and chloramphenicol sensitivity
MSRPAEYTRTSIIKAAAHLFAEKGFEGASVRDIVTRARVNQAAIHYHFKGKDGLYLEVLKTAFERLTSDSGFDAERLKALSREEALRSFIHQQLRPLLFRDELSRYIRMFSWESAHPSKVFLKFMTQNPVGYVSAAVELVRRFLPDGMSDRLAMCAAIWLMGQCGIFVRSREMLEKEPFNIGSDEKFVDELTDLITRLALGGLLNASAGTQLMARTA